MIRARLVIMVRQAGAGRVKTRLGRDIGMVAAAWWYRHQVRRQIKRLCDPRWDTVLAVSPDRAASRRRDWPAGLPRIAQGGGDLGQRMARILRQQPPGPVCIVGSDIPGLGRRHIRDAFAALGHHDAVFGPAADGGYWLVGMKRVRALPRGLFAGVRWSGPHALADTIATLGPLDHCRIATLHDVDDAGDLAR